MYSTVHFYFSSFVHFYFSTNKRLTVGRYVWPEKGKDARIDAAQMLRILEGTTLRDRIESDGKITQRMF